MIVVLQSPVHPIPSFGELSWKDYATLGAILVTLVTLHAMHKMPSLDNIKDFVAALNSRGGNLLILVCLTVWFFHAAVEFFYRTLWMIENKALTPDNALVVNGWTFITGVAFGGSFAALLKSMTGSDSKPENGPPPQGVPK